MITNPQFIGSQQTHHKKSLHQIDLQEHRGEHCIEDQKERRIHLDTSYGGANYSLIIRGAKRMMKTPSVIIYPSGRVPKKASRLDLGSGTCGGENCFLSTPLGFWGF